VIRKQNLASSEMCFYLSQQKNFTKNDTGKTLGMVSSAGAGFKNIDQNSRGPGAGEIA
jgi:hypothetical protein